ncbi:hypothetical protein CL614_07235 [archaeon]|nr:hypothetical protein [archaeon]|tara:strand:+ start:2449 stop:3033 length:585 start_codon:yes stop_codon:yes gene_type:complete
MRKIQTQADIDKKKKRNGIILGVVLVGLLVVSTLGYSLSGSSGEDNKKEFNGYEFNRNGVYWVLDLEDQEFAFQNLPQEVTDVSVFGFYDLNSYFDKVLYFVNLDEGNEAGYEILNNLERYVLRWQETCLEGEECEDNLPVKTCEKNGQNLIIFEESIGINNSTSVRKDNNCVYISGDFVRGSDAFLYKLLGIS